ncbi:MAG: hydrogenase expression/formation protein HypE [Gammaproteobacteria bacterium]|nr:hydrogenase expression/formation protein HypE [Gammaproteobacteria bacterium]
MSRLDLRNGVIEMSHGSGGRASSQLIEELFIPHFDNELLRQGNDATVFDIPAGRMVITTDAHVVSPLFFPGGDIGSLSVHGTINDVAMSGAKPLYLSASVILEEGFPLADLEKIVISMAAASRKANVPIIAGDTKVVERGKGDGLFISTTGIGIVPDGVNISGDLAQPGDLVLLNGFIGDHGIAILSSREGLEFNTTIKSDSAALNELVSEMVQAEPDIHCLRDPTRGGLATTLNELAKQSEVGIQINETTIPVRDETQGACELLGLDPLYIANEGKLVCICPKESAKNLLNIMQQHPLGKDAVIIGQVVEDRQQLVVMKTTFGGQRVVDWLAGEQLPRIC